MMNFQRSLDKPSSSSNNSRQLKPSNRLVVANSESKMTNMMSLQRANRSVHSLAAEIEKDLESLRTPVRQMKQLQIKSQRSKQPKLLSSKSLSQFVSRGLFFMKRESSQQGHEKKSQEVPVPRATAAAATDLTKRRLQWDPTTMSYRNFDVLRCQSDSMIGMSGFSANQLDACSGRPSASSSNSVNNNDIQSPLYQQATDFDTLREPSLSPIVGELNEKHCTALPTTMSQTGLQHPSDDTIGLSSTATCIQPSRRRLAAKLRNRLSSQIDEDLKKKDKEEGEQVVDLRVQKEKHHESGKASKKDKGNPCKQKTQQTTGFKPFKDTALALRDIKNSISLRLKAKQESQKFARLTNELQTPPTMTKLYSPFNIYTDSNSKKQHQQVDNKCKLKSRRRLNWTPKGGQVDKVKTGSSDVKPSPVESSNSNSSQQFGSSDTSTFNTTIMKNHNSSDCTPKQRIALRNKRQQMQTAKQFSNFQSPTNQFRDTVADVEHFQLCIEQISKAIRTRSSGGLSETNAS